MSIIKTENVDYTKQPLFFGEDLSLQRYDVFKYKKFYELFQQQLSFFWRPEEIDITTDSGQFKELTDVEKRIFTKNLSYQTLLDSCQARGIPYLLHNCSNPELEAAGNAWTLFEQIHSYSYTYIIKNIYSNPTEVFDSMLEDKEVLKRATSVTKYYDDYINSIGDSEYEKKKKLYLTLISINILEGIRFYVSFACSFSFAERGKMEGNAKIISFILRDENCHLAITQNIINILRKNKDEGFEDVIADCEEDVINMYKDAATEEMEWAKYLFKDGSIMGLNDDILIRYMKYLTNKRMKSIGLPKLFEGAKNPINWITKWTDSKAVQSAPQETELESYKVSSITHDSHSVDFSQFNL
jgi:ribonucleoside-diphosphate reductase beta chain